MKIDSVAGEGLGEPDAQEIERRKEAIRQARAKLWECGSVPVRPAGSLASRQPEVSGRLQGGPGRPPVLLNRILDVYRSQPDPLAPVSLDDLVREVGGNPDFEPDRKRVLSLCSYMRKKFDLELRLSYRKPGRPKVKVDENGSTGGPGETVAQEVG